MLYGDPVLAARHPEDAMLPTLSEDFLADQLLRIAREPELRQEIYDQIGEYCHQCRNRLNSLKLSLYLLMRQKSEAAGKRWSVVDGYYQELERKIDLIQTLCRPLALSKVTIGFELLIEDRKTSWTELLGRSGKRIELVAPSERTLSSFDVERMGSALDAFVRWRAGESQAGTAAKVRWWAESGLVHLVWQDSGRPSSLMAMRPPLDEAAWALPLLARIVLAHEGEFKVEDEGGYRLEISWPTLTPTP